MVRPYVRSEERPFSEVIERRIDHDLTKVRRTLEFLYWDGSYGQIELYEEAISDLSERAMERNLVGIVSEEVAPTGKAGSKRIRDPRPKLDFKMYSEAREAEMTNEEIRIALCDRADLIRVNPSVANRDFFVAVKDAYQSNTLMAPKDDKPKTYTYDDLTRAFVCGYKQSVKDNMFEIDDSDNSYAFNAFYKAYPRHQQKD